jgi:hypothetical protein
MFVNIFMRNEFSRTPLNININATLIRLLEKYKQLLVTVGQSFIDESNWLRSTSQEVKRVVNSMGVPGTGLAAGASVESSPLGRISNAAANSNTVVHSE